METKITFLKTVDSPTNKLFITNKKEKLDALSKQENAYFIHQLENKQNLISINRYDYFIYVYYLEKKELHNSNIEKLRQAGHESLNDLKKNKIEKISIINLCNENDYTLAFAEGLALSNYQFLKYFKDKEERQSILNEIIIEDKNYSDSDKTIFSNTLEAVYWARDLVNEPLSYLTARKLSEEISNKAKTAGYQVQVLDKKQIEALKMGGLLAVNNGSIEPPTFNIIEYKPTSAKNQKPLVLVGKGVVFDTGGLSLKPTPHSMDIMKADMGGAAAVAGTLYAVAKSKLPIHVIGLIPSTENRPGLNAYVPGDVVRMYNGSSVEVLNTDAEGRMILADALAYAKKYNPELVIDLATLTGAAVRAVGKEAIVAMRTCENKVYEQLSKAGEQTYERLIEFPLWEEYGEMIKSDIADLKNIGGSEAGAITAGKFLEHFTDYPWVHLDIAASAFLEAPYKYLGKNGTGAGIRLLVEFISKL